MPGIEDCTFSGGKICRELGQCFLLAQMIEQGLSGGTRRDGGPAGPMWDAATLYTFITKTIELAESSGCGDPAAVAQGGSDMTAEKIAAGELYSK